MARVDAARRLMAVPGRGAEATGRLFAAKRFHEAAKHGHDPDAVAAQVLADVSDAARPHAEAEVARILARWQAPK